MASFLRAPFRLALVAALVAACDDPAPADDPPPAGMLGDGEGELGGGGGGGWPGAGPGGPGGQGGDGQDEGDGPAAPPAEGEGGEGQDRDPPPLPPEGEGEGEGDGLDAPPDAPPAPPREAVMICGSAPSRVVRPAGLRLTATAVLPEDMCEVHLQPFVHRNEPRRIRMVALETLNAPACAGRRGPVTIATVLPMDRDDDLGEWTFEFVGLGPTILRKRVLVEPAGGRPPPDEPTCEGGRVGFPGVCGEDLFCSDPGPGALVGYTCGADGLCVEQEGPGVIEGAFEVFLDPAKVTKGCRLATEDEVPPAQCFEAPGPLPPGQDLWEHDIDIDPATLVLDQDPDGVGDMTTARLSFLGPSFLSRWQGDRAVPGTVVGNTFLGADARILEIGGGDCTRVFYLQIPRVTRYDDRLVGRLGMVHLEVNCGRGCLACELAGPIELVAD